MEKQQAKNKKLYAASYMPPLRHKLNDEEYDRHKSEVLQWIAKNPFLLEYVFSKAISAGYVQYDAATSRWQGVNRFDD